ncbi:7-dehydrocholesterol reductase [Escovopsis weberi]|uniref:7-dehydrocholesterol reductase n=1 Tax=Escovopsis weberi TaxID=150374 RepID=A0A0M8N9N9_ESCWE|nr:7-dehydrocholesterol reductase [Escovopsis weberi]
MKELDMIPGVDSPSHGTTTVTHQRRSARNTNPPLSTSATTSPAQPPPPPPPTTTTTKPSPSAISTSSPPSAKGILETKSNISNQITWGRASIRRSWLGSLVASSPGALAVLTSVSFYVTLTHYGGSLSAFLAAGCREGFPRILYRHRPRFSAEASAFWAGWVLLQALLYRFLPGPTNTGQRTPAGHLLAYRTNGLRAWAATHALWAALCWAGLLDPGFVPRNWGGLSAAMNLSGFLVSAFAYAKAHLFPSHPDDRNFSGSAIHDFYMGIELNPRFGDSFDFKLFSNGRPGIIFWTLIDFSNIAYVYQTRGRIEPSLVLVTLLHTLYVVDFFINEGWYLRTIDIAHDHYGFYLAWGCFCYLPTCYTIQGQYLGLYPSSPPAPFLAAAFGLGLAGYALFRSVNDQKDRVRRAAGRCAVWGKPAVYLEARYTTSDGRGHTSLLLCSGWWGFSRHANYVGDLMLSYAMCALAGSSGALVWFYAVWMTVLLVHRCKRDERRCRDKYGATWDEYCRRVPYRFIPGVW